MCNFCKYLRTFAGTDYLATERKFWNSVEQWEADQSNDAELFAAETEANKVRMTLAHDEIHTDPAAAQKTFLELAQGGSVWSMYMTASLFDLGWCAPRDDYVAMEWYHKAISGGSWSATLGYANVLNRLGHGADADEVLQNGVDTEFAPAMYRLARMRYDRDPDRASAKSIRNLLEKAAEAGHPAAQHMLAGFMLFGRYGIRFIPRGWSQAKASYRRVFGQ